ncbi:CLUMA_CG006549, isoform A, partial [Clunio marinus]
CRLTSGGGLLISSAFVYYHSLNKAKINRYGMSAISLVLGIIGGARLLNMYPFNKK